MLNLKNKNCNIKKYFIVMGVLSALLLSGCTAPPASTINCDPNYSGCVPVARDVDCAGGGGDGPVYVRGPIKVIGVDIYGLDRDNDGIACERN